MFDANDLYNAIKVAAMKSVEASQPSDFCFGKVTGVSPLKVSVEQKLTLGSAQLVLSRNVTDYSVNVTVDWNTEQSNTHAHEVKGVKKMIVHNGLKIGDEVILLKKKGGQKYLILDRVVNT